LSSNKFTEDSLKIWRWLREGASTAFFRSPRWDQLAPTDAPLVFTLVIFLLVEKIQSQQSYMLGAAQFHWQAIVYGWLPFALLPFYALTVRGTGPSGRPGAAPDLATLVTLQLSQMCWLNLLLDICHFVMWARGADTWAIKAMGRWGAWILWGIPVALVTLSQLVLLARAGRGRVLPLLSVAILMISVIGSNIAVRQPRFWIKDKQAANNEEPSRYLKLTAELMESQPVLLSRQLAALAPQRPGKVDMYALTFAPYGDEVFRRESQMVADVMSQRFDTAGRTLQLVNHFETAEKLPWATTLNLRKAIRRVARTMDKEEDVLFIYLTSHGAREGQLAADFWPFELTELTPAMLRKWLDEAEIKHRVIAVSACYSGSWIPSLKDDATLVLTAADADHTSYGCGYKSELTFFGRAMFDEQLRSHTRSFEQAHAAAREVIRKREVEAGKADGYSNPQISVGPAIRAKLATFQ
jgi:hypothetical protein